MAVRRKCQFFAAIGAWPSEDCIAPRVFLDNFDPADRPLAVELLDAFVYYNHAQIRETFQFSIRQLQNKIRLAGLAWSEYADRVVVTYPTGEDPSPADSGHIFVRLARSMDLPHDRIVDPAVALAHYVNAKTPVLFVDDFLGSGSQMYKTWNRTYSYQNGISASFASAYDSLGPPMFYCCAFATEKGISNLARWGVSVDVEPAYRLGDKDGVLSPASRLLDPDKCTAVYDLVKRISQKIGFPDSAGQDPLDWMGFAQLGLAISLEHGTPDATIPLFYSSLNGWKPLVKLK